MEEKGCKGDEHRFVVGSESFIYCSQCGKIQCVQEVPSLLKRIEALELKLSTLKEKEVDDNENEKEKKKLISVCETLQNYRCLEITPEEYPCLYKNTFKFEHFLKKRGYWLGQVSPDQYIIIRQPRREVRDMLEDVLKK